MSDLQLVTGFSILISGLSQLRCGLTTFYWRLIVEMAWLSCFTHLVCLTMLREYLYNHPSERLWRVIAMGALAAFVVIGLFCEFFWLDKSHHNSTPAICFLEPPLRMHFDGYDAQEAMFSAIVIILGFVSRVVILYREFSVKVFGQPRSWVSLRTQKVLETIFKICCKNHKPKRLRRSLFYRPLFVAFLSMRFLLGFLTSLYFEVRYQLYAI
jgi:uncharacterized membrane protein